MGEFDYQWENLPSPDTEYNPDRINELLTYSGLNPGWFKGKNCLDAGCGNGRFTYALQQLGGVVSSFDVSSKAVEQCRKVNPEAYVKDILTFERNQVYDFVLCWGVLHHLENPHLGFEKVSSQVRSGGFLLVMVYHKDTQKPYLEGRKLWPSLNEEQRLAYCREKVAKIGGTIHGWYDAFNPQFNWSFEPKEVKKWFELAGFKNVRLTQKYNINMIGWKE